MITSQCGDTATFDITVQPDLDATITPIANPCESDAVITLTAVDGGGTWSGNGITDAILGTFDPSVAGAGSHVITYEISSMCGDTATETITVQPDLDPTITPVGPFCESDATVTLTAADPGGFWSGQGVIDPTNGIFDPNVAGVGTHTISYMLTSQCGDTATVDIQVLPDLDATITPVATVCESDIAITLTAVDGGGTWSGVGITDPVNGTFDPSVAGAGSHVITYAISSQCGDTATTTISVDPGVDATITPAGPFCESVPAFNMTAVDGGGTWSGTGINASGLFDPSVSGVGTFTVTYTISGICSDIDSFDVVILPDLDATITPVGPFCESEVALNLTAVDGGGTWSGNGITDVTLGTFEPTIAGTGTHTTVSYTHLRAHETR